MGFLVHSWNIIPAFENYGMDVFKSWTLSLKGQAYYCFYNNFDSWNLVTMSQIHIGHTYIYYCQFVLQNPWRYTLFLCTSRIWSSTWSIMLWPCSKYCNIIIYARSASELEHNQFAEFQPVFVTKARIMSPLKPKVKDAIHWFTSWKFIL